MSSETIKVKIDDQQNVDRVLKKFKRLCESYGIVREYKKRQSYAKPSVCLKEKRKSADKRRKKTILKQKYSGDRI
ncbi:MAG: 30S ribosomal protein S21 [Oligoflexia bacterium]|nr:30S ribosomal protein S21 [Oligoflexia bacterium]MBF0366548.1 30S ribosomal protein S21 [Oligoflexia bacterium]